MFSSPSLQEHLQSTFSQTSFPIPSEANHHFFPTFSEMGKTPTSMPWFEYKTFSQKACVFKAWSPDSVAI